MYIHNLIIIFPKGKKEVYSLNPPLQPLMRPDRP